MDILKLKAAGIKPVAGPFETAVEVPGSKSYTNRALLAAALSETPVKITGALLSDDTKSMSRCLNKLGIKIDITNDEFIVKGSIKDIKDKDFELNAGLSGITIRFITALCSIVPGKQIITGEEGLNNRPIGDLVEALRSLGADITYLGKEGFPPIKVSSSSLNKSKARISGGTSSQFLSALLLISPLLKTPAEIKIEGKQISAPYVDMTLDVMHKFGVDVKAYDHESYEIKPQKYEADKYHVEGDFSSAAYFFAAAVLNGSKVTVSNLNPDSKQADRQFLNVLGEMNAKIETGDNSITVTGGSIRPIEVNMQKCPDQAMTMAVLAAFAPGKSTIRGIGSLRVKETERIVALENELAKMGISSDSTEESLTIQGGEPSGSLIDSYGDHRIAMSFAVAGTKTPGIEITDPGVVDKTFPGFWDELKKITNLSVVERKFSSILLVGMRGSGKTTVGKTLAKKLGKEFIDMDEYLEEKYGKKIRDIVLEDGWDRFRRLESDICAEVSRKKNRIFSSGGGIVLDSENMKYFADDCLTLLLKAEPRILSMRIRTDKNRPELSTQPTLIGELGEVWRKRKGNYFRYADFVFDTTSDSPNRIANNILDKLGQHTPKICMVIGDPIKHSLSPDIHNLGYRELGIDDEFVYEARRVKPDNVGSFIEQIKNRDIRGVSLTMPHKELVIPFLDSIDPIAEKIGAVNTIVQENGILRGYNTDWIGAVEPLRRITELKEKKAAIIGGGGTAKAFAYGLTRAGCDVTIYNRTVDKARLLAERFGCKYADLQAIEEIKDCDIICNTTSVGMDEDKSPINPSLLQSGQIVYDVVYSPLKTRLLKDAEKSGAKTISGIEMLLEQAFAQFRLFTGKDAPEEIIRKSIIGKLK
ncbi:MAG TPA: 3-phosphoshikimate 1-carboxyvinyltransferase [Candidatus Saccharimonadales bacterium]|nr:3-phosphoshikimate 1-carboxyvinyltransferase [Candidatus Saccharimonadales bacterium]